VPPPKILILTHFHGGSHRRAAKALASALAEIRAGITVEVIDALHHCASWFRAYYNSYLIPLRYWPSLWGRIERHQHQAKSTGPNWIYRRGARLLFGFLRAFDPDVVVATEVGLCELAALFKREQQGRFRLVGVELMDFNRAWIQPEVDLYLASHVDLADELAASGAPSRKIFTSGQPIDPAFAKLPDRERTRERLGLVRGTPVLLALFGGAGFGNPRRILEAVRQLPQSLQVVIIAGRNPRLEERARELARGAPQVRVLGWVDNMHEWLTAADVVVTKPGGSTLMEAFCAGLPVLVTDPLPGNEQRTCQWIERWKVGRWLKRPEELVPALSELLTNPGLLTQMRERALAVARPYAARDAAQAILRLIPVEA
jgi:processive 1,2-diacylglycerol beta-glucosyltransferase